MIPYYINTGRPPKQPKRISTILIRLLMQDNYKYIIDTLKKIDLKLFLYIIYVKQKQF